MTKRARTAVVIAMCATVTAVAGASATASAGPDAKGGHERVLERLYGDEHWQGRILWLDLSANRTALDTREEVQEVMRKSADVGFDTVAVDVKNYTGYVAYNSEIAPHLSQIQVPGDQGYPEGYDLLQTIIEEGHAVGLDVIAATNIFSEGATAFADGPAYEHPEWQTEFLTARHIVGAADGATLALTGIDVQRGEGGFIAYTPEKYEVSPANQWGVEAQVTGGIVTGLVDRVGGSPAVAVPDDGYVLSGHGASAQWMRDHLAVGEPVALEASTEIVPASEYGNFATFVNPILPEVQEYELSVLREIASNYDVDGISLDRARYADVYADFSDESRAAFEQWLGRAVADWPAEVMTIELDGFDEKRVEGPLFKEWVEWRAWNVQQFMQRAEHEIHAIDADLYFSDYVGAWYPLYYEEGGNWGSRDVQPDYDWASDTYGLTGYAEDLDFLMVGTYFGDVTESDAIASGQPAPWYSVEGSAEIATAAIDEATWVYASLFLQQYEGDPDRFRAAMEMAMQRTHGIMLFDLVYLEQYGWWGIVKDVFDEYGETREPHTNRGWQNLLRADG